MRCESELATVMFAKEGMMKLKGDLADQNKELNVQIDDCLLQIMQLEAVNKVLQSNVENYMECDSEARSMLDRKQKMNELLRNIGEKLKHTSSAVAHLF
jgi:hypothetical protein